MSRQRTCHVWLVAILFGAILVNHCRAQDSQVQSAGLGRGVNLGNILEAPSEGEWGVFLTPELLDRVAEFGFEHVRFPASWTHYTQTEAPYTVDEAILDRVEWAIDAMLARDLKVIVNVHHYEELNADPIGEEPRALAMWEQIAERYSAYSDEEVYFEILNEPHGKFTEMPELWNVYAQLALNVIRESNPTRKVLVGPARWNSITYLDQLILPNDPNLIATFHFYDPFNFTHQGAGWIDPVLPVGVPWSTSLSQIQPGFQNHSWNTEVSNDVGGVKVQFNEQYAGYFIFAEEAIENATNLVFSADQPMQLRIRISDQFGNGDTVDVETTDGQRNYVINLKREGLPGQVKEVRFQLFNDQPVTWRNRALYVRTADGERHHLIRGMGTAIETMIEKAAAWAVENEIPIYLGEFGTNDKAVSNYRSRWTRKVRVECEKRNIDWGYWSISMSMGFYDPNEDVVNKTILKALIVETIDRESYWSQLMILGRWVSFHWFRQLPE